LSDEISRRCTTECPKKKGVLDVGDLEDKLVCYINYSLRESENDKVRFEEYDHIKRQYKPHDEKTHKESSKFFCQRHVPFGATADVSWNTGTITCQESCTYEEGIVSEYRRIKIGNNADSFIFSICYTSFRCPNDDDDQVLYAMNKVEGDPPFDHLNQIYCIGDCYTNKGFIAEVPMGSSVTLSCNLDYKCPSTAPYVYEFISMKIGEINYNLENPQCHTGSCPMMQTIHYYEEFEEDYKQNYERFKEKVYINAIGGINNLATKCAKACTRLDGILYATSDLSSADDISHDYKRLGPWRNYDRGFCYNSTKRCLNSKDYRRIRSDGLHSTITCVKRCNRYDGYILEIEELINAYLKREEIRPEITKILNQPEGTNKEINEATIKDEFFPNEPSDICLHGNLVT